MTELWIGFDFDGTLVGPPSNGRTHGDDIESMVSLLRLFLSLGVTVKIFSARAGNPYSRQIVQNWLESRGLTLEITDKKDFNLACIIDDLAISVFRGDILTPFPYINTILSKLGISIQPTSLC